MASPIPTRTFRAALLPLFLCTSFLYTTTTSAGCLNCGFTSPERSYEGEDVDYEDISNTRTGGSMRTKINRLDDEPVSDLIIPVLFGVSLKDLWPNFGDPRGGGTRLHEGLDILAPDGTPVVSPTQAVVIRTGKGTNSGIYVSTANPGGETFIYMHLTELAEDISSGDELRMGDLIGYVGDTGNAKGGPAHLHFEIREGRKATDPYTRITKEILLTQKMKYLARIFGNHDDEEEFAQFLVSTFEPTFIQATVQDIDLPEEIERSMPDTADITAPTARDLSLGSEGADVSVLQSILIAEGFLDISSPTGHFGPLTQEALRAYQTKLGITPATGHFGVITRTAMHSGDKARVTAGSAPAQQEEFTAEELLRMFIALGIIPPEKEAAARLALQSL